MDELKKRLAIVRQNIKFASEDNLRTRIDLDNIIEALTGLELVVNILIDHVEQLEQKTHTHIIPL